MLLFLDRELVAALPQLAHRADYRLAFENIALSRREGYHVVLGAIEIITGLANSPSLSPAAKAIYKRIANESTQIGAFSSLVETQLNITTTGIIKAGALNQIGISLTSLAPLEAIAPTRLIGENLDDCKFYKFLGQSYAAGILQSTLPLSCVYIPGGGSNTPKVYAHNKPLAGATLAITDSDKHSPNDSLGDVAKAMVAIDRDVNGIGRAVALNAKGVENIIPIPLLSGAFAAGWKCELGLPRLRTLHASPPEIRFFSDLKNGLSQHRFLAWPEGGPRRKFWDPKYKGVRNNFGAFDARCDRAPRCDDADDCDCWVVNKVGSQALSKAVASSDTLKPIQVWRALDTDLKREWERIGKTVVSWCCGMPRLAGP